VTFRGRYGDAIADIVETYGAQRARPANRPATHDIKATLQALVADPEVVDLRCVDSLTRTLLMDPAWRRLRSRSLGALTREQLAECAKYALDHFPPLRKPIIERAEVTMTLALLAAARTWHAARRVNLVREALSLAFNVDHVRATAILRKAHRELRAGM
jgi:hypothetical protein